MFYRNARIYGPDFQFHHGAFQVIGETFGAVLPSEVPKDAIDLGGATVIPGLVDIHTHGNSGFDFSDSDYRGLLTMSEYYARAGVTSFAPASMSLPLHQLEKAFDNARKLAENAPKNAAVLRGIHMEGPYFSHEKRGAQNAEHLKAPVFEEFQALYDNCGDLIRIVDIAPELPGAIPFISRAKDLCTVSVAHTDATYDQAKAAFNAGATHITHLYNTMPAIHHRAPGVIPAAAENKAVRAELICDGHHVHPAAVRLAFSIFSSQRMILISDSGRCCGMENGSKFDIGGQEARLLDGIARLPDGTIACSAANLYDCVVNAISFGISEEDAVRAATYNPACAIGADHIVGSIAEGKRADFLVCDSHYRKIDVFCGGKKL